MTANQDERRIPTAALLFGVAGIIPFAACAVQVATAWPLGPRSIGPALYLLLTYAAVILSFMGGVQWGLTIPNGSLPPVEQWRRYGISVAPALAAWVALYLGARAGVVLTSGAFAALLVYDLYTVRRGEAPSWYGRLRIGLTAAVIICLLAAALFGPF